MKKEKVLAFEDKPVYLVKQDPDSGDEKPYWSQYDSIENAVSSERDNWDDGEVDVYMSQPKHLGAFKIKTSTVKAK